MKKVYKHLLVLAIIFGMAKMYMFKSESYLRDRAVVLSSSQGLCSGEQVRAPSGQDYILTAGHCKDIAANGSMMVTDSHGNVTERKVIAEDPASDLLLLEGLPGLRGLDIAAYEYGTEHVRTFTHGGRMATYKTEGELIQKTQVQFMLDVIDSPEKEAACKIAPKYQAVKVDTFFGEVELCIVQADEMASTAQIMPGSSGGMVVDDSGDLVGVASCTGKGFNFFVTLSDIRSFLSGY